MDDNKQQSSHTDTERHSLKLLTGNKQHHSNVSLNKPDINRSVSVYCYANGNTMQETTTNYFKSLKI
jgi:hypothetical protein